MSLYSDPTQYIRVVGGVLGRDYAVGRKMAFAWWCAFAIFIALSSIGVQASSKVKVILQKCNYYI